MGGNNFWRMANFSVGSVAPVLDPGGLFKWYDLHKVAQLSTSIEEMGAVTLNYNLVPRVSHLPAQAREE